MSAPAVRYLTRSVTALLAAGAAGVTVSPLTAGAGQAATTAPMYRTVSPPNVFYPVKGGSSVRDLGTYSTRHPGTDIKAPCGTPVYASNPGIARIDTNARWSGQSFLRLEANPDGLVTGYGYMNKVLVKDGQVVAAGQQVGVVGDQGKAARCQLYFRVRGGATMLNPTSWLNNLVGKPQPIGRMFGATAPVNVVSSNILGENHTRQGEGGYATYDKRLPKWINYVRERKADVIGVQEMQGPQADLFTRLAGDDYGMYYWKGRKSRDTDNAVIWNKATMRFIEGHTIDIKYFSGNVRRIPVVLLEQRSTGRRAWFINTHNPASSKARGDAADLRAADVQIIRDEVARLRAKGLPVFATGDFNDYKEAFCPMTARKLMISPNSVPSMTCQDVPYSIDWVFAAGPARFTYYQRDLSLKQTKVTDHPVIWGRAFLGAAGS